VTEPCCCRFGKWVNEMEGKEFTKHPKWRDVKSYHEDVHNKLQDYVNTAQRESSKGRLKSLDKEIKQDTEKLFHTLEEMIKGDTKKIFNSLTQVINEYA